MSISSTTEVKPAPQGQGLEKAAPQMYEALMYLMHHPSECSPAAWDVAREALEAAGMKYDRDVAQLRADRMRSIADRMFEANNPHLVPARATPARSAQTPDGPEPPGASTSAPENR